MLREWRVEMRCLGELGRTAAWTRSMVLLKESRSRDKQDRVENVYMGPRSAACPIQVSFLSDAGHPTRLLKAR